MNYQLNSYVNRQEAEALKEMIFKRVRERANTMTSDVQSDVMNIARESFVSQNNPFSIISGNNIPVASEPEVITEQIVETSEPEVQTSPLHEYVENVEAAAEEIGFPQRNLSAAGAYQYRLMQEQMTAFQVQNTMMEARTALTNKKSFMGALSFLNSHAAASLLNKRAGSGVDIVA